MRCKRHKLFRINEPCYWGEGMKEVKVEVSKEPIDDATVSCKKLPIGIRLFNKLFGNKEKMTVIILGRDV